jgi:CheY-like chemotaxis protein
MLRRLIGEDIVTTLTEARAPLIVKADGGQLEQVVMNLATNARDAMPDGGHLAMETFRAALTDEDIPSGSPLAPGHYAALRVTDDGMGIPPTQRHLIFDPFFTTKSMGNGLGLSTVFGIVRQSGGDITVISEVDQGTAVTVYLPLSQETPSPTPEVEQMHETKTGTSESILLVEDEPSVALLAERVLLSAGYRVVCAGDGRRALDLVEAENLEFDLLFTDVVMPNLDGPGLARRLEERLPGLKVLYCSGYPNEALTTRGVLEEGVELIQKPYGTEQLRRRIRSLLDAE